MRSWELRVTGKGESVVCVLILATVRRKLFYFAGTFLITQIFYFILFSYKDQTLCPHVI